MPVMRWRASTCPYSHRGHGRWSAGVIRENPELVCPVEYGAGSPLADGRVDLSATAPVYRNSGFAIADRCGLAGGLAGEADRCTMNSGSVISEVLL